MIPTFDDIVYLYIIFLHQVDIAFFPFDDQMCSLKFGSWIYTGDCLNFHGSLEDIGLQNYIDNSEWQLVGIRFKVGHGCHGNVYISCSRLNTVFIAMEVS